MNGGPKPLIRDEVEAALRRLLAENNHLTLAAGRDRLAAATGVRVDPLDHRADAAAAGLDVKEAHPLCG
jgi:hypothetical protein